MKGYNFTEQVRRALARSREEAARLHHESCGTEHLLLGLIADANSGGARILAALPVDVDVIRASLDSAIRNIQPAAGPPRPDLPYTARAKTVLELAMAEAHERDDVYVGTEHLLLGLLREAEGIAAQVLASHGVTIDAVRRVASESSSVTDERAPWVRAPYSVAVTELSTDGIATMAPRVLLVLGLIALVWSAIGAADKGTWVMEVFPIFIAVPLLVVTARRFPLTPLVYYLIFVHALILMVGGHYTYAKVPLGFWMQSTFHFARNHYDRIGHFAQGFVPAIIAREILIRRSVIRRRGWLFFLVTCICLSISVCYEFIEWAAAVLGGSSADAFLGTQGDVWDTQWDMFMALIGSLTAQLTITRAHDGQLGRLAARGDRWSLL